MLMKWLIEITLRKNLKIFEKPKNRVFPIRTITFILLFLTFIGVSAQELRIKADSIPVKPIEKTQALEKVKLGDTTRIIQDSLPIQTGGFETTVKYYAEDSIITKTTTNVTYLYGNAYIEYGRIKLAAEQITIDRTVNEVRAIGIQDSLGNWEGRPIFQDGGDVFETEEIRYNFETQKARIIGVATEQPDGYLRGTVVKRNPDNSAYIKDGKYTPCLDNPNADTYIKSKKIKIIPGKSVITGPFLLYIGGIPTPLGLPFGYFPDTSEATSGILFPKWGDEQRRGFFLRDGGYYQVWNDQLHTALTFDVYSKGSWAVKARNVYKKRYRFGGSFDITYNRNITPEYEANPLDSKDFWVSWSHRPESRGRNGRFSASVQAGTSTYNQNNLASNNFQNNIRSEFRSNVSYSGSIPRTPFSYSLSGRHSQNIQTNIVDISLPEASLNMNRIFPMKRSKSELLKKLSIGWNLNMANRVTNLVRPATAGFDIVNKSTEADTIAVSFNNFEELLQNAQNGAKMRIPISTSFPILNNLNITPSVNIDEIWYLRELDYSFVESENAVRIDTINGFSRANTMNASLSIGTQLYGTFNNLNPLSKTEAIRHIMTPGMAFSYRPDYGQEKYGYYQTVQTDTSGTTRQLSIYDGFLYGSPSLGESAALSFQVSNKVEMKVRSDTAQSKKVSIIDNFSISGGYNFLADSFNLSLINLNLRTNLFDKKLSVNMGAVLDPYSYLQTASDDNQLQRRNIFAWQSGQGIGRITSARASFSTNLNPNASSAPQGNLARSPTDLGSGYIDEDPSQFGEMNQGGELASQMPAYFYDPNAYVDVNIPWNLRMSYDFSYNWNVNTGSTIRQAVKAYGQLALTPKWDVTFNTSFDIEAKEFTQTSVGIYRDLGCWELRGNWIPFGAFTSYSIDLQIKASALKDLKLSRRRSQFDN